jgi:hypothetical protein
MPIRTLKRGGKAKRHFLKGSIAGHRSHGRADRMPRSKQGGGPAGPMPRRLAQTESLADRLTKSVFRSA